MFNVQAVWYSLCGQSLWYRRNREWWMMNDGFKTKRKTVTVPNPGGHIEPGSVQRLACDGDENKVLE